MGIITGSLISREIVVLAPLGENLSSPDFTVDVDVD
jgi:hypothetical protein